MTDWKTPKKDEGCARCSHEFADGEALFSILLFTPETLGREDRCVPCFVAAEALGQEAVFWKTRRQVAKRRGLALDFDSVERLFHALDGRREERLEELRYLLSLLLMRKKRLKLVRVRRDDGGEWMLLRRPRQTETVPVRVFDLTPERAQDLRGELEQLFEGAGAEDLLQARAEAEQEAAAVSGGGPARATPSGAADAGSE